MSIGTRLVVFILFSSVIMLTSCGGGGGRIPIPTPPPSGSFSNTSLNGTYTFSVAGANASGFFAMTGTFVACGCSQGTISSGTVDLNDPSGPAPASPIGSNSAYNITPDGRGTAQLFVTLPGNVVQEIDIDFVLTSSAHGLVVRFDNGGTGSGSIDLQPAAVMQSELAATPYAFILSGVAGNFTLSTVGAFRVDSSGNITTGVEDFNEAGTATKQQVLQGSLTVGTGTSPGTATLITNFAIIQCSVYAVDATHFKLIENDGVAVMVGDLLSQPSTTVPAGNLIFSMNGLNSASDLFVTLGIMTSDGASLITSGSEDVNDAGVVDNGTNPATPFAFSGSFLGTGGGRFEMTLTNYVGGSLFAAYPSSAGLLMMEIDSGLNAGVTGGIAMVQQAGATVAASQGYGLNLTGEDRTVPSNPVEFDEVDEFKTTSTAITGLFDQNDGGSLITGTTNGTYSVGSDGFGSASLPNGGFGNMFFYAVDNSTALCISTDIVDVGIGSFQIQTTPGTSAHLSVAGAHGLVLPRVIPNRHSGIQKGRSSMSRY